jgi:hypothetical protein
MPSSPFIAIETNNGVVQRVEGQVSSGSGGWLGESYYSFAGKGITEVLNHCAEQGYEHFDTDVFGDKKIYRMKLTKKP